MLRTFNCGVGMIVVVSEAEAAAVAAILQSEGETVVPLGPHPPARGRGGGHLQRAARPVSDEAARKRVAVLISGRGSNMSALIGAAMDPSYPAEIVAALSNKPDAGGLATGGALRHSGRGDRPALFADRTAHERL